jgi:hypothetical protein
MNTVLIEMELVIHPVHSDEQLSLAGGVDLGQATELVQVQVVQSWRSVMHLL